MKLSKNAKIILRERYLLRNENREIIETPLQMFRRVAKTMAEAELKYGKTKTEVKHLQREFLNMMINLYFIPNSPTLMNARTKLGQLSACFVLSIDDDIEAIFQAVKYTALIHKSGGGTGFSLCRLRPKNDVVKSTGGKSSGPNSFLKVIDVATSVIKQGGKRRGANMVIQRVDHPDIQDFITLKKFESKDKECPNCGEKIQEKGFIPFSNCNLSVAITDKFMNAVKTDGDFELINPRNRKVVQTVRARTIWSLLTYMSWNNGEPAVVFIDTMNRFNPTPEIGEFEATNPCGETPLLSYESCNLGSINVSNFYRNKKNGNKVDWVKLRKIVRLAVRFLDNVIDINKYPLPEIKEATLANRKIGLGIMGWADLLLKIGIRYDTLEATKMAEKLMKFIQKEGRQMSRELGKERGSFPNKDKSIYKNEEYMRNATITTIAPTGTISIIANTSQGIEPIFAIVTTRNVEDSLGTKLVEIHPAVKTSLQLKGLWNPEMEKMLTDSQNKCLLLPPEMKKVLVTAHQVSFKWHVKMVAAFQKYTDNAVSKTVNLNFDNSIADVEKIYLLAYKLGCKGITVYRDGSRKKQLLTKGNGGGCPTCD